MDAAARLLIAAMLSVAACGPRRAAADEGGVSFWLPGNFGSSAATPGTTGWSWATVYYHTPVSSVAGQQFPRSGHVGISGQGDLAFFGPTYVFATPVLGAQASFTLLGVAGRNEASAALSLTGPLGNTIALNRTQDLKSHGDIIPQVTLKWNKGVHIISWSTAWATFPSATAIPTVSPISASATARSRTHQELTTWDYRYIS